MLVIWYIVSQRFLERTAIEGNSPVGENNVFKLDKFLSRVGHEKSGLNQGGPPSKAK